MASYEILRTLDRGGMAEVFLARLVGVEGFEKRVVLKRVLPHLSQDRRFVERFLDEARLAAGLSHPNLVQIFELGQQHGQLFIAMEHVDGKNLRDVEKRLSQRGERMPLEHALRTVCSVCEALHYAHGLRSADGAPLHLVHRDVSPSNVLVSFDGGVKLIDFGIAKTEAHVERTRPGAVLGKCSYMSPEQARGEHLDGRSDLFSCGAILYSLVTGRQPFSGADDLAVMRAIARGQLLDPREAAPDVDEPLAAVLRKALAHRREDRYARALDLQLALEGYLASRGLVSNTALLGEYLRALYADEHAGRASRGPGSPERTESQIVTLHPTDPSRDPPPGGGPLTADGTRVVKASPASADDDVPQGTLLLAAVQPPPSRARPGLHSLALLAGVGALLVVGGYFTARTLWPTGAAAETVAFEILPVALEPAPALARGEARPDRLAQRDRPGDTQEGHEGEDVDRPSPGRGDGEPSHGGDDRDEDAHDEARRDEDAHDEARRDEDARDEARRDEAGHDQAGRDQARQDEATRGKPRRVRKVTRPEPPKPGALTLDSEPWSEVFLGAQRIGMTPIASHPLPAGRHKLTLVNRHEGLRRHVVVEVQPGRTTRLRLRLEGE